MPLENSPSILANICNALHVMCAVPLRLNVCSCIRPCSRCCLTTSVDLLLMRVAGPSRSQFKQLANRELASRKEVCLLFTSESIFCWFAAINLRTREFSSGEVFDSEDIFRCLVAINLQIKEFSSGKVFDCEDIFGWFAGEFSSGKVFTCEDIFRWFSAINLRSTCESESSHWITFVFEAL